MVHCVLVVVITVVFIVHCGHYLVHCGFFSQILMSVWRDTPAAMEDVGILQEATTVCAPADMNLTQKQTHASVSIYSNA